MGIECFGFSGNRIKRIMGSIIIFCLKNIIEKYWVIINFRIIIVVVVKFVFVVD